MTSDQTYGRVNLSIKGLGTSNVISESNSNIFSDNKSFGKYKYDSGFIEETKRLRKIQSRIEELNKTLILAGKKLADIYPVQRHEYYIKFNNYIISSLHPFYSELKDCIKDILGHKKAIIFQVTLKGSKLVIIKNNKKKSINFNKEINCTGSEVSGVCTIQNLGFISL